MPSGTSTPSVLATRWLCNISRTPGEGRARASARPSLAHRRMRAQGAAVECAGAPLTHLESTNGAARVRRSESTCLPPRYRGARYTEPINWAIRISTGRVYLHRVSLPARRHGVGAGQRVVLITRVAEIYDVAQYSCRTYVKGAAT